jgi:hypothetical protein
MIHRICRADSPAVAAMAAGRNTPMNPVSAKAGWQASARKKMTEQGRASGRSRPPGRLASNRRVKDLVVWRGENI